MTATAVAAPTGTKTLEVRSQVIDASFVLGLVVLGLIGFRTTYGGVGYLVVGTVAAVLGMLIGHLAERLRQPVVAEAAVAVIVFFLLGGAVAVPSRSLGGVIPTTGTLSSLLTVGVHGWKELLTIAPPVGNSSNLLAIPYIIGLVGGVAGYSLARRTRLAAVPLAAPIGVLAVSILFGTEHSASLLLQGSLFGAGALAWVMVRHQRNRHSANGSVRRRPQMLAAGGVILVAALGAPLVGPRLPFVAGHPRVVLSRYVVPPFNAENLSSPLAAFRQYTAGAPHNLAQTTLFKVGGVNPGTRVRIATMDSYNGLVWGFGAGNPSSVTVFRRYGSSIPSIQTGKSATVTVNIDAFNQVWLPDLGDVTAVHFSGPGSGTLSRDFRYDQATGTGANPTYLTRGDSYQMQVVIPTKPTTAQLNGATAGTDAITTAIPGPLQAMASQWAGGSSGAWAKVIKLAGMLKTLGRFSNGTESPPLAAPGHSAGRLDGFIQGGPLVGQQIVGDDEQFAATLALMANSVGVPARVVLGAIVEPGGVVKGSDVHAWVEVSLAGLGWVTVDPSTFLPTKMPTQIIPQPRPVQLSQVPVSPPTVSVLQPPPDDVLPQSAAPSVRSLRKPKHGGFHIPTIIVTALSYTGPPVLVVLAAGGAVVALKARRRRRRLRLGSTSARIAGGWYELIDQARDLGHAVPPGQTRREQAGLVPGRGVPALATAADGAVFGPDDPSAESVATYWSEVSHARKALRANVSRWRRIRADISLSSLRQSGVLRQVRSL